MSHKNKAYNIKDVWLILFLIFFSRNTFLFLSPFPWTSQPLSKTNPFDSTAQDLSASFEAAAAADEVPEDRVPGQEPPPELSRSAIDKRLRRVMQPRADGTDKVPEEIIQQWKDPLTRDKVMALFEKCGYKPDHGLNKTSSSQL